MEPNEGFQPSLPDYETGVLSTDTNPAWCNLLDSNQGRAGLQPTALPLS